MSHELHPPQRPSCRSLLLKQKTDEVSGPNCFFGCKFSTFLLPRCFFIGLLVSGVYSVSASGFCSMNCSFAHLSIEFVFLDQGLPLGENMLRNIICREQKNVSYLKCYFSLPNLTSRALNRDTSG